MRLIAHRGNIIGENKKYENDPNYLNKAIESGFEVEIDIFIKNSEWYFGHDEPSYKIGSTNDLKSFINNRESKMWFHCKNSDALEKMSNQKKLNYFWHQNDDYTITSHGFIWAYPGKTLKENAIILFPEKFFTKEEISKKNYMGLCSDFVDLYN
tara:strand:- start:28 stop:489 length:462 start_codon:yes stop_codon:yes gene_type:complete